MAKCNFKIKFEGSAKDLVAKAKKAIQDAGGTFTGNASKGRYSVPTPLGKIAGTYTISKQTAAFAITQKPFLVPCSAIENKIREYLGVTVVAAGLHASVQSHAEDILPHVNHPASVAARVSSAKGCITLLDVLEVCYTLSSDEVKVCVKFKTPVGSVNLGCVVLTRTHTCATLGGHIDGFKAEVEVCFDFTTLVLKICGKACVPVFGCKSGCTSVHL